MSLARRALFSPLSGLAKAGICPDTLFNGVFDDFKKIGVRA
jgi:hypothetical protein